MVYGLSCFHFKGDPFVTIVILGGVAGECNCLTFPRNVSLEVTTWYLMTQDAMTLTTTILGGL